MQQIVVGDVGVAAPAGSPPIAVHVPPVAAAALTLPLLTVPMLRQVVVPVTKVFGPAEHARSVLIVAVSVPHVTPAGAEHVHAEHARVSLNDA